MPNWILRNLNDFGNCIVNYKTYVEYGLKDKILALYGNVTFTEVFDDLVETDIFSKKKKAKSITMIKIELGGQQNGL